MRSRPLDHFLTAPEQQMVGGGGMMKEWMVLV
jgi:hypothetical protein